MENRTLLIRLGVGSLLLLIVLAAGCLLGWIVFSFASGGTSPAELATEYKEDYTVLVGAAYACDQDLAKAQARLDLLGFPNSAQWVAQVTEAYILEGGDECDIASLVRLSDALGMSSASMIAYLPTVTPLPMSTWPPTPVPTAMPLPSPTATPSATPTVPPTALPTERPTDMPTVAPPTDTAAPPTDTPAPADTPKPAQPTNTPRPKPTNTPKPTSTPEPPVAQWTWTERLVGVGEDAQSCGAGLLQVRVEVLDEGGNQVPGIWIYDRYSKLYAVTGDVDSPDWGPGETMFNYGSHGGGSLCIAASDGGPCETEFTRDMPCFDPPPFEDMWTAGYCQCCGSDAADDKEICRAMYDAGDTCARWGHYAWRVVYRHSQ